MITGRSYSGKEMIGAELCNMISAKVISMTDIANDLKKSMGTEEEPFEGDVPLEKVETAICAQVAADRNGSCKFTYMFCDW